MPYPLEWQEIAVRLILTVFAGALIGLNRGGHGHPAGLRTTLLVCLAASLAMIQANLLLGMAGRPTNSYVMLDLMRLPLGILSGMGFIGAGVILKRENLVLGVTTAATLWFVTVIGLCFGGGQIGLGLTGLALGVTVLWGLKELEIRIRVDRTGTLVVHSELDHPGEQHIRQSVHAAGFEIIGTRLTYDLADKSQEIWCNVRWRALPKDTRQPSFVVELMKTPGISRVGWEPTVTPTGLP